MLTRSITYFTPSGITCDSCKEPIYGTRVVCVECGLRFTFDFCDKPACVGCTIPSRDDIAAPHLPTHDFVKIRAPILHYREIGRVLRDAKAGLERARGLLEEREWRRRDREFLKNLAEAQAGDGEKSGEGAEENEDGGDGQDSEGTVTSPENDKDVAPATHESAEFFDEVPAVACLKCKTAISRPCLYCIDCPCALSATQTPSFNVMTDQDILSTEESEPLICWDCDEQEAGFDQGEHHLATHNLVRCMEVQVEEVPGPEEDNTTEKRLGALEQQMVGLRGQMEKIEALLHALTNTLTG